MGVALCLGLLHQVRQADRDQDAVDGPARPMLLQQAQKAGPGGAVHLGIAVLGGIAPGGVQQHRLVGEPPVAVAGAADAVDGVLAELLGQREAQPGVDQRGGLAAPGRADDQVPGELVDPLAAQPTPAFAAP